MSEYAWDFFIAHAGADVLEAERLHSLLVTDSTVFLDSKCLKLGDDWDHELSRAQRSSRVTVVLVSKNTNAAYYEREEIAAAIAMARKAKDQHRVVPVYLDDETARDGEVPYGLRLKHGITVAGTTSLGTVADRLRGLLRVVSLPPTPVPTPTPVPVQLQTGRGDRQPGQPDTATIRRLLSDALSDDEFVALCMDHFRPVFEQFTAGMGRGDKIQRLIEHCVRRREIPKLLDLVRQLNPAAFGDR